MGLNKNKYQGKRLAAVPGKRLETAEAAAEKHPAAPKAAQEEPVVRKLKTAEAAAEKHTAAAPEAVPEVPAARKQEAQDTQPERAVPVPEAAPEEKASAPEGAPEQPAAEPAKPKKEKKAKKEKKEEEKQGFWANYGYLLVTAAVVILVFRVLLQLAFVPSSSMETTIPTNSLLVSWQIPYLVSDPQPQRFDVVTFWSDEYNKLLVKRVIGLPGEEITFSGGYVYVNGRLLEEDYLPKEGITKSEKTFVVPEGCLFMLGDNRTGSTDSRYWSNPYVKISDVRASVMVCIPVSYHPIGDWKGIPLPIIRDIHLIG